MLISCNCNGFAITSVIVVDIVVVVFERRSKKSKMEKRRMWEMWGVEKICSRRSELMMMRAPVFSC